MTRYYLQTKKTTLSYGISDSETTIRLQSLLKLDGTSVSAADIGDYMTGTFDPGTSKEEIFSIASSGVTVNADGTVDITGVVRGLREGGTAGYSTGGYSAEHGAGAVVVFSNNPQLYNQLANKSNDNTFTGQNVFSGYAPQTDTDPVNPNDMTRLSYVQALVLGTLTTIDVVVPGTAGETIADGNLIYLNTDNKWYKTDADTASTVNNVLLGIAKGAGVALGNIANGVLLQGVDNAQSGLVAGEIQYASNTAGAISSTPGTTEVTVGVAKSATELYFAPRFNQQITEDQQDAMAGTSGNPSASNKFVTDADTSTTAVAGKVARFNASGGLNSQELIKTFTARENVTAGDALCLFPYQSDGGVLVDNTASGSDSAGTSITIGNNSNRILLVFIATNNDTTPTATFGGNSMTQLVGGTGANCYLFYILAPLTGSQTLAISTSSTWTAYSIYNATQSAPSVTANQNSASPPQNITTTVEGSRVFTAIGTAQDGTSATVTSAGAAYTNRFNLGTNAFIASGDSGQIFGLQAVPTTWSSGNGFRFVGVQITPITTPTYGDVYKTSASNYTNSYTANKYTAFIGFAKSTVTSGNEVDVTIAGIATGLSGLTRNLTHYLSDTAGLLSSTAGTNSKKVGQAVTSSTLNIIQSI